MVSAADKPAETFLLREKNTVSWMISQADSVESLGFFLLDPQKVHSCFDLLFPFLFQVKLYVSKKLELSS